MAESLGQDHLGKVSLHAEFPAAFQAELGDHLHHDPSTVL